MGLRKPEPRWFHPSVISRMVTIIRHFPEVEIGVSWADGHDRWTVQSIKGAQVVLVNTYDEEMAADIDWVQHQLDSTFTLKVTVGLDTQEFDEPVPAAVRASAQLGGDSMKIVLLGMEIQKSWDQRYRV